MLSAPRSPWQRAYVERLIGFMRRECLDHTIIFGERSLYRALGKDAPRFRPTQSAPKVRWSRFVQSVVYVAIKNARASQVNRSDVRTGS